MDRRYRPIEERVTREYYSGFVEEGKLGEKLSEKQKMMYKLWLEYRAQYDNYV